MCGPFELYIMNIAHYLTKHDNSSKVNINFHLLNTMKPNIFRKHA